MNSDRPGAGGLQVGRLLLTALVVLIFLLPMLWVVVSAFKPEQELGVYPPTFLPHTWTLANFDRGLRLGNFWVYILNTAFVTVASTVIAVLISTMAGFAFAKYSFPGKEIIFIGILATLMFSLEILLIPMFLTLKQLGLINSLWGIIIPPAATPTGIFLMRQYMVTIPDEVIEAARIDGAGEWQIFARIMVPLSVAVISTLTIFSFVWRWNDYIWPFLVINSDRLQTIQLALAKFAGQYGVGWGELLAMTSLSMLPMLVVFLIFQRRFLKGIALTGLKA